MKLSRLALAVAVVTMLALGASSSWAAEEKDASKEDVSKKSFKHPEEEAPVAVGAAAWVRRAKLDMMSAAAGGTLAASLAGGTKVTVQEDAGEWVKVATDTAQTGFVPKADLRTKAPTEWTSNRKDIQYQECLGKGCDAKKAKEVGKDDKLIEIDRGGPDNAFLYVKMPGDVYGWVPIAFMKEWKKKFD